MKELEKNLAKLHNILAEDLLARVQSGEATAAELTVALKLLQHNNIEVGIQKDDSPLMNLADVLPFQHDENNPVHKTG